MEERLPGIVDFADIGEFIDASIKTYSSGMRARLGFAIATAVDPDVLIIDEVLSTGDAVFRAKSKQRIIELTKAAKGIVLVTHDMAWVTEFCNRAMLLDQGHVILEGPPGRGRRPPPGALGAGADRSRGRARATDGRGRGDTADAGRLIVVVEKDLEAEILGAAATPTPPIDVLVVASWFPAYDDPAPGGSSPTRPKRSRRRAPRGPRSSRSTAPG